MPGGCGLRLIRHNDACYTPNQLLSVILVHSDDGLMPWHPAGGDGTCDDDAHGWEPQAGCVTGAELISAGIVRVHSMVRWVLLPPMGHVPPRQ